MTSAPCQHPLTHHEHVEGAHAHAVDELEQHPQHEAAGGHKAAGVGEGGAGGLEWGCRDGVCDRAGPMAWCLRSEAAAANRQRARARVRAVHAPSSSPPPATPPRAVHNAARTCSTRPPAHTPASQAINAAMTRICLASPIWARSSACVGGGFRGRRAVAQQMRARMCSQERRAGWAQQGSANRAAAAVLLAPAPSPGHHTPSTHPPWPGWTPGRR